MKEKYIFDLGHNQNNYYLQYNNECRYFIDIKNINDPRFILPTKNSTYLFIDSQPTLSFKCFSYKIKQDNSWKKNEGEPILIRNVGGEATVITQLLWEKYRKYLIGIDINLKASLLELLIIN
jgi:hypothetical protein